MPNRNNSSCLFQSHKQCFVLIIKWRQARSFHPLSTPQNNKSKAESVTELMTYEQVTKSIRNKNLISLHVIDPRVKNTATKSLE